MSAKSNPRSREHTTRSKSVFRNKDIPRIEGHTNQQTRTNKTEPANQNQQTRTNSQNQQTRTNQPEPPKQSQQTRTNNPEPTNQNEQTRI